MNEVKVNVIDGLGEFYLSLKDEVTQNLYRGPFKVKCVLSPIEFIEADISYRELIGPVSPQFASQHAGQLAYALSQLKYRIVSAPPFWDDGTQKIPGGNVPDNILLKILELAIDCEVKYREELKKSVDGAKEEIKKAVDEGKLDPISSEEDEENDLEEEG